MNDAPRRWWNVLNKALRSNGMVPTRADRCCYVLYSSQSRERAWKHSAQGAIAQQNGTKDAFTESRKRSDMEAAFEKMPDPKTGSPAAGKSVARIIHLFVDDLFGTGGTEMKQRVLTRLGKYFQVGSEDCSLYKTKNLVQNGQHIEVSQDKAIDSGTNNEGRPPLHSFDAFNVQKPSGRDKLATK